MYSAIKQIFQVELNLSLQVNTDFDIINSFTMTISISICIKPNTSKTSVQERYFITIETEIKKLYISSSPFNHAAFSVF